MLHGHVSAGPESTFCLPMPGCRLLTLESVVRPTFAPLVGVVTVQPVAWTRFLAAFESSPPALLRLIAERECGKLQETHCSSPLEFVEGKENASASNHSLSLQMVFDMVCLVVPTCPRPPHGILVLASV